MNQVLDPGEYDMMVRFKDPKKMKRGKVTIN